MSILDIIAKKRDKKELTKEEIEYFIKGYTEGKVTDYQAAALVMAIYINGMNDREITDITLAMAYSGDVLDLSELGEVIDKHSTGGVGDKITLILMPIIASLRSSSCQNVRKRTWFYRRNNRQARINTGIQHSNRY